MNTKRLHIRRFTPEDLASVYEYLSDPKVVEYEPYLPLCRDECEKQLLQMAASKDFWAVCLRPGGEQIGQVYLAEREQATWEVGYVFHRKYQHRGLAGEAVEALVSYVFESCGAHRVIANCNPQNSPSWKLLERLGFHREGRLEKNVYFNTDGQGDPIWQDTLLYGVLRSEWKPGGRNKRTVSIARAEADDAKRLAEVYNLSFYSDFLKYGECPGYGKTEQDMLEGMRQRIVYKILADQVIVGAISVRQKGENQYYLGALCVIPDYANQGIGQTAMELLDKEFPAATHWALVTPADKLQNHYFYKKFGYEVTKEYKDGGVMVSYFERRP